MSIADGLSRAADHAPVVCVEQTFSIQRFAREVTRIFMAVRRCLDANETFDSAVGDDSLVIYVKTAECRIVYVNAAYNSLFAGQACIVGRSADGVLDPTIVSVSKPSDQLILSGADELFFRHSGVNAAGQTCVFQTAKRSLIDPKNPGIAILGITETVEILSTGASVTVEQQMLASRWQCFTQLDQRDQLIAISLAKGQLPCQVAEQMDVTKRTVENRRTAILENLDLPTVLELAKLMVRFESHGYGDFHV